MWTFIAALLSVLSALASVSATLWLYIHAFKYISEFQEMRHQMNKMHGRIAQKSGTSKKQIREAVDDYMEENPPAEGGGGGMGDLGEALLPMLLQGAMGGGQGQAQQQEPEEEGGIDRSLLRGQGGMNDATPHTEGTTS